MTDWKLPNVPFQGDFNTYRVVSSQEELAPTTAHSVEDIKVGETKNVLLEGVLIPVLENGNLRIETAAQFDAVFGEYDPYWEAKI